MTKPIKAQVAPVNLGHIQIPGLLGEDKQFYVAVPQIAEHFQFAKDHASRGVKALLGKGFQFAKASTPLNPKAVNAVTLDQFHRVLFELSLKENALAREIMRDMSALGLHQLFCDAFGIHVDAQDRAAWLQQRIESKELFWELTAQIKTWMRNRECSAAEFTYYANAFDCLNLQLFGKKSKQIREECGVDSPNGLTRDRFGVVALRNIGIVQSGAARMMAKEPVKPSEAIKAIVQANYIEVGSYKD